MQNNKENESLLLEMRAKCVLNDISNQEDLKTNFNWISKVNSDKKGSLKLPSISSDYKSAKSQFRCKPWLIRQKENLQRQKMDQIVNDMQNSDRFPDDCIRKKLDQAMILNDKENVENSPALKKKKRSNRYVTQNDCQVDENEYNYHTSFLLKNKGFENESKLKKNWSVNVRKALANLGLQKESMNKQIQSIKSLIEDKRIKCRMLSKQGYLIVKQQSTESGVKDFYCGVQKIREKHKSLQKNIHRQKNIFKTSDRGFQDVIKCKSFLTNAYQILATKSLQNNQ